MDHKTIISYIANAFTIFAASISESELAQWILFALGVLSTILSISISLFKVLAKWKEISQDGKITKEEMEDMKNAADEALNDIHKELEKRDNITKERKDK